MKKKEFNIHLLSRVLKLSPYKPALLISLICLIVIQAAFSAAQPALYQFVIDTFMRNKNLSFVLKWTFVLLVLLILLSVIGSLTAYFSSIIGQGVIKQTRQLVYKKLLNFKFSYFDKTPVGLSVTRVVSDIETLADLFASGILTICGDIVQIVVITALMFVINWKLAILSLLVLPILLFAANRFRKGVKTSFQEVRVKVAELNSFLQEHITGMSVIKQLNRQSYEMDKFSLINKQHSEAHIESVNHYSVFFPIVDVVVALAFSILIFFGSQGIVKNYATAGELTAFIMFINLFFRPIRTIADRFNNIQMGLVAAERIFEILDNTKDLETNIKGLTTPILGDIEFKDVFFEYVLDKPVLNGVSFKVKAGETIAIVGSTGSGKTSTMGLLSRFYNKKAGSITVDSVEIEAYDLLHLRKSISVIQQDVFLFGTSITDNITLYDKNLSLEKAIEITKEIGFYDYIQSLPGGFDFIVNERGQSLSVGQRQLLSFVRAIITNPPIVLMDEATSSIDSETELLLQNAIEKLVKNRTAIVVAHRLSTIKNADRIIVLEKGLILEEGTHQALINKNGYYANYYKKQLLLS